MYVIKDHTLRISVRNLVEFLCRSGDIDDRAGGSAPDVRAMQEGARIHRKIQKEQGTSYHAEVPLKLIVPVQNAGNGAEEGQTEGYTICLEGRADGIICDMEEDDQGNRRPISPVTIDEIKTVQMDITRLEEPIYVHKAQALCYAWTYAVQQDLQEVTVQLTYCNPDTDAVRRFPQVYTRQELEQWFEKLLQSFLRWTDYVFRERVSRQKSIRQLAFPFPYREGQKKLVAGVYHSIQQERNLFIQAPTGVGKTISTIFPSVQAMGQGMADKLFYLTSKTITRTVAEDTFHLLREKGLYFRSITLTAKDKACILEERACNPEACSYAKGHFDRINDAVYDLITSEKEINRDKVLAYAARHKVCPFELSLDASSWCDGIICDYNYVFDPDVALKRYFGEGSADNYLFLVDEAHNLVDRAREMYSAVLKKEDFLKLRRLIREKDRKLAGTLERCNRLLLAWKRECTEEYRIQDNLGTFPAALERCYSALVEFMDKHKGFPQGKEILEFFFAVRHFLNMYDCGEDGYVYYTAHDTEGDFYLRLYCVDPSAHLSQRLAMARSTVFFSATLLPVTYFKEMLSGDPDDYAIHAESSFQPEKRRILIGRDVSSRYTRRNVSEYRKIAEYLYQAIQAHPGNYMAYFPSYRYMEAVRQQFTDAYPQIPILSQDSGMTEQQKEEFLDRFAVQEGNLLGFCVTGGIFSEGIDLKEESLIGAIIVGTGLPMLCRERNILRGYFDAAGRDGYRYAYVYPGMNKVLQAAGRVIRTAKDRGIILLLDDRFLNEEYQALYPREWEQIWPVNLGNVAGALEDFWQKTGGTDSGNPV